MNVRWMTVCFFSWLVLAPQAALAQPEAKGKPNVLFIVADDLNTDLGCYGHPIVKTPNIDRLAARGVRFDRAYCQWPLCVPSRASFLSGLRPTGAFGRAVSPRQYLPDAVFLPQHFRQGGYFTGRVGKVFHAFGIMKWPPQDVEVPECWDVSELGGTTVDPSGYGEVYASTPKHLDAHPELKKYVAKRELIRKRGNPTSDGWLEMAALDVPDEATGDGHIARRIAALMGQKPKEAKPFFLAAGFRRPHLLFVAPKRYFDLYPPEKMPLPREPEDHLKSIPPPALTYGPQDPALPDDKKRLAVASYYACISFLDAQVGVLLDALDRLKLWDSTVVVLTSDHGYHTGEHGGLFGKVTLFEEAARVPLIIAAPSRKGASGRTVELVDLYPTLTELCGLPTPKNLDGRSLAPLLTKPDARWDKPAYSVIRRGGIWGKSVRTERYRYTEWNDTKDGVELYDHADDPKEYRNLAKDDRHSRLVAEMRRLLEQGMPPGMDASPVVEKAPTARRGAPRR